MFVKYLKETINTYAYEGLKVLLSTWFHSFRSHFCKFVSIPLTAIRLSPREKGCEKTNKTLRRLTNLRDRKKFPFTVCHVHFTSLWEHETGTLDVIHVPHKERKKRRKQIVLVSCSWSSDPTQKLNKKGHKVAYRPLSPR